MLQSTFIMVEKDQLDALKDIRSMMKQSSKFLSLSGLSGVFAGIYALVGAYLGNCFINDFIQTGEYLEGYTSQYFQLLIKLLVVCVGVLVLSIISAFYFSNQKAKKLGQKLFDHTTLRLFINMFIPLLAGGLFCLAMLLHGGQFVLLIGPCMLIFYGLALVNGSKYTLHDIRYLGVLEIVLGLVAIFYLGYGIIFWSIGFGVLHILYGIYMWFKYDKQL